jgi:hypothetical protein
LITQPTFTVTDAADSTHEGYTFRNTATSLVNFQAGGTLYRVGATADQAFVRRNSVNANRSSVWYRGETGTGAPFLGAHAGDYGALLLGNNINRGSDNTFANGTNTQTGNIERLDFVWSGGRLVDPGFAVAVFDRGAAGAHDAFRIALITGWDAGTSRPTAYSNMIAQAGNWGGANFNTPAVPSAFGYTLFRYTNGDNLGANVSSHENGTQGVAGMLFNLASFGVAPGTTVYGYSLFGYDVNPSAPGLDLLDWNTYPTNTSDATGTGGIDLLAINGLAFSAVPEPAAFGLAALGALAAASTLRRPRRAAAPARGFADHA